MLFCRFINIEMHICNFLFGYTMNGGKLMTIYKILDTQKVTIISQLRFLLRCVYDLLLLGQHHKNNKTLRLIHFVKPDPDKDVGPSRNTDYSIWKFTWESDCIFRKKTGHQNRPSLWFWQSPGKNELICLRKKRKPNTMNWEQLLRAILWLSLELLYWVFG